MMAKPSSCLRFEIAAHAQAITQSLRLRHRVFVEEMGARARKDARGLEFDHYDAFCHHLLVIDQEDGEVVACTRILTDDQAERAGGFYSAHEFDLHLLRRLPGRMMEIGRTCVHPAYRNGATIGLLWQGLARFMQARGIQHLFGCASIPMHDGGHAARQIMHELRGRCMSPHGLRVTPRLPLPPLAGPAPQGRPCMPPLLKAYMRLGAQICGEPCWDPDFRCADVFVLLDVARLEARYHRHFLIRQAPIEHEARPASRKVAQDFARCAQACARYPACPCHSRPL